MASDVTRSASTSWRGDIATGEGRVSAASGAFMQLPFSLASRIGDWNGQTSPEELVAAAFSACFTMSIAAELTNIGVTADRLDVLTDCREGLREGVFALTRLSTTVVARIDDLTHDEITEVVSRAYQGCPVGQALSRAMPVEIVVARENEREG
jgi:lipoyl-dependent peroxiredoxin